eukprot:TRINITY_DN790_c0_g1_i4.p1 TRINITY_DN790_c0_g1~~TRINITY_DN790_c0_g1_i4.p1  ORF type:complete len:391 (-),score=83.68 TRINITY_DN790_c0_g1_i4:221-1393(-)
MLATVNSSGLVASHKPAKKFIPNTTILRQGHNHVRIVRAAAAKKYDNTFETLLFMGVASMSFVDSAQAADTPVVDSAVSTTVNVVQKGGETVKTGLDYAGKAVEIVKQAYETASPVVKETYSKVAPVVEKGVKTGVQVVGPAVEKSIPIVKDSIKGILSSVGVETNQITKTTSIATDTVGKAVNIATPTVNKAVDFVSTTDPTTLAKYGVVLAATYFLLPNILGGLSGAIRGYAGDISPTQALDTILSDGKSYLLDVRTLREKEQSGVPDVPGSASGRFIEVPFATTEDRRVRGLLRNADGVEKQITAILIASIKKLDKSCSLFLMDRNGGSSRAIAKELNNLGFGRAYVVSGGFEGWNRCKLQTKPSSSVQVVSPGFGTVSFPRRALPK